MSIKTRLQKIEKGAAKLPPTPKQLMAMEWEHIKDTDLGIMIRNIKNRYANESEKQRILNYYRHPTWEGVATLFNKHWPIEVWHPVYMNGLRTQTQSGLKADDG